MASGKHRTTNADQLSPLRRRLFEGICAGEGLLDQLDGWKSAWQPWMDKLAMFAQITLERLNLGNDEEGELQREQSG